MKNNRISLWNTLKKVFFTLCFCVSTLSLFAQGGAVTGTVTDETGATMPGVNVMIKGSTTGVVTNADGKFSINASSTDVLQISFVGYTTKEIEVGDQISFEVSLSEGQQLEEVVVTGMGITRESRALGYAVTTIQSKELTKVGSPNFATALYGKAPGVRIQQVQGGSIAGVSINVRGFSSLTGNVQPLVILNGVPVRNGGTGSGDEGKFSQFGDEGRIRANGLVDINTEDIESLTILKGAAATALYGSEAANGVVMITSKQSKTKGISVDVNATWSVNQVAYVPQIQNEYGPSVMKNEWTADQRANNGLRTREYNGQTYKSSTFSTRQWGPKYDGSDVLYWDGTVRKYEPISDDPWQELLRTGFNQNYNVAINQGNDWSSTRFSYTYNQEKPNALVGNYQKHNFNVVGTLKPIERIKIDYSVNYILNDIKNRASNALGRYMSWSDMFGSFSDVALMKQRYKNSLGYRADYAGSPSLVPNEALPFDTEDQNGVRNYMWDNFETTLLETQNRFLGSVAPTVTVFDWLSVRGRFSTDLSSEQQERKSRTERPLALHDPSGEYSMTNRRYNIYYGDVMLLINKQLTEKLGLTANFGWQGRSENMMNIKSRTDGGLTSENWFSLNASRNTKVIEFQNQELLKTAWLGTIGLSWDSWLYVDATLRNEKSSTLNRENRTYTYPSFSASFIYTDAFRLALPSWYYFGKLRASYGMVGNAPTAYAANVSYNQGAGNGLTWNDVPDALGNEKIRPEQTTEFEIGLENKFFKNRFGFEFSYYKRNIEDMILSAPQPTSSGATNILLNVGTMVNSGFEVALNFAPIQKRNFTWDVNFTIAKNTNEITALIDGVDYIQHSGWGGNVCLLRSYAGRPMGDFYSQMPELDANGNKLVNQQGLYINQADHQSVGNALPKFVGGLSNQFTYKDFFFDVLFDFRIGGKVFNETYQYTTTMGITPETVDGRSNGIAYYFAGDDYSGGSAGKAIRADQSATQGPNGETIFHDGVIQEGVYENGQANATIVPYDYLTYETFAWGTSSRQYTAERSVFDNSFVKCREMSLGYNLPSSLTSKFGCRAMTVSVFGRNLFYVYKAMKNWDAESAIGTNWTDQARIGGSASPTRSFGLSLRMSF